MGEIMIVILLALVPFLAIFCIFAWADIKDLQKANDKLSDRIWELERKNLYK